MSTFVYGKAHPLVEPAWYLLLDGPKERSIAAGVLLGNVIKFARDPHHGPENAARAMASMALAIPVDCGLDRVGWYMNKNGGMCPSLAKVIRKIQADTWPNQERITVSRWPNCKHYYARVDGIDVVWRGQNRWNTESQARRCAEKFMARMDKEKSST